jgi:hypothetical protein
MARATALRGGSSQARTAFETAAGPLLEIGEVFEELGGAPATLGGQGDDVVEVRGGVVQAEAFEGVRQWGLPLD